MPKLGEIVPNRTKTLREWNREREEYWSEVRARVMAPELFPNGLICDVCGGNLYDTMQMTAHNVMRVKCRDCNFKGERYE